MPVQVPTVSVYAGDTVDWPTYTFRNASNQPRDLNAEGWTNWAAQWRTRPESVTALTLDVDDSKADEGIITIKASAAVTAAMEAAGVWDLQATKGGVVHTFLAGKTKYTKDVTRGV